MCTEYCVCGIIYVLGIVTLGHQVVMVMCTVYCILDIRSVAYCVLVHWVLGPPIH